MRDLIGVLALGSALALACGLGRGPREEALEVASQPNAEVPAPRGLEARSGELRQIPLGWEPVIEGDVAGYLVERSLDGEVYTPIAALEGRFHSDFVDRGEDLEGSDGELDDGTTYHYRVRAVDSRGRLGRNPSSPVQASTVPAPASPEGLRAFSHLPRQVALTWRPAADPTVAGYVVSRSPSAGGPFETIQRIEGRFETRHLDSDLGDLRVFYYRVAAFNSRGAEGESTEPVVGVTKAEPLPPAGLRVTEKRLGENQLAWEPNVESDVTGYRLLRYRRDDPAPEIVAVLGARDTSVSDTKLAAGEVVSYAVVAFDSDGLESLPTDAVEVVCEDYDLRADVEAGAVHLHWNPRTSEGFSSARILRQGLVRLREIARVPSEGFVDTDVEPGRSYRYVVTLERGDGLVAPPSNPVEVRVPLQAGGAEEPDVPARVGTPRPNAPSPKAATQLEDVPAARDTGRAELTPR